jgi:hypothetical protein
VDEIGLHDERDLVALDADVLVAGLVFKDKPPALDSTAWSTSDADTDGGFRLGLRIERFLELLHCFWRDRDQRGPPDPDDCDTTLVYRHAVVPPRIRMRGYWWVTTHRAAWLFDTPTLHS